MCIPVFAWSLNYVDIIDNVVIIKNCQYNEQLLRMPGGY